MKKSSNIIAYIFLGLIPSVLMFACHGWLCDYDMNPLCYIKCSLLAIVASPLLLLDGDNK